MIKTCLICHQRFESISHTRKYCSPSCRVKAKENYFKKYNQKKKKIKYCVRCEKIQITPQEYYCKKCRKIVWNEREERIKKIARKNSLEKYHRIKNDPDFKIKRNERYKIYNKKRREEDYQFQTSIRLRNLLYQALKKYSKKGKTFSSGKYGIDFDKIIESLKPFPENMKIYHIDHIIPLSSFNLNKKSEIQKAFAPENLQWLEAKENIRKSNKMPN